MGHGGWRKRGWDGTNGVRLGETDGDWREFNGEMDYGFSNTEEFLIVGDRGVVVMVFRVGEACGVDAVAHAAKS